MIVIGNVARDKQFTFVVATLLLIAPLLAACSPLELTCAETATCPPPDGSLDGSVDAAVAVDAEPNDVDVASEPTEPPDAKEERLGDSSAVDDAPTVDALSDVPLPPLDVLSDVTGAADVTGDAITCDTTTGRSPANTPCLIDPRYGVFVSPQGNDTSGDGTRAAPYKTLAYAIDNAKSSGKRVYVCDDGTGYLDPLAVGTAGDGASLYGGFDCSSWSYATTRRARVHPPAGSALVVRGLVAGLILEDFELVSADVAPGASSIAAIVDASANVTLRRVRLAAGKGGSGADGADGGNALTVPDVGDPQRGSAGTCGSSQPPPAGAWLGPSSCSSLGGAGGQATLDGDGTKGFPGDPRVGVIEINLDNGGPNGVNGADGTRGSEGVAGDTGRPNTASGTFNASGYVAAGPGGSGGAGHTGQGGGGGGASSATAGSGCYGATGGAGGMGGCGGPPGSGGASGGASVALLSWMSQVTLDGCDLVASEGGSGGKGGNGSLGNDGKTGASGGVALMPDGGGMTIGMAGGGGPGGHGGNGGSAAGGNGGPSHALVSKGTAPIKTNDTVLTPGAGGAMGIGGALMGAKALDGVVGASTAELVMP